jgi:hypothetical protein
MIKISKVLFIGMVIICFGAVGIPAYGCYWYFNKTAPMTEITLQVGQPFSIGYEVAVAAGYTTAVCPAGVPCPHLSDCRSAIYDAFDGAPPTLLGTYLYSDIGTLKVYSDPQEIRYDVCGDYQVVNEATLKLNPASETPDLRDSVTIDVHVPCSGGCTLTPGYWKTHSNHGPAPYDSKWEAITPSGADSPFFKSNQTWYGVLWTAPSKGNAYYILAHAYIAATLNTLNGAQSTPAVASALAWASTFFNTYAPTDVLTKAKRNQVLSKASILDQYNNGYTGPGHCSE